MAGSLHNTRSRCTFKYSLFMIACLYATCRLNHQLKCSHNNITETDQIDNKTSKGNTNSITLHIQSHLEYHRTAKMSEIKQFY